MTSSGAISVTNKPWMAFDLESVPMPSCADYLTDPIEAPANYKDPLKIAAWVEEKRQKQIADAGLDLDLCEIAAIAIQFPTVNTPHATPSLYCQARASW